jgi:ribosomal-protein-alanine N-acetyltransferase
VTRLKLSTERLELVAGTAELAHAERGDRPRLARLLRARLPDGWPPPLNDDDSRTWVTRYLDEHPEAVGWTLWYVVLHQAGPGERGLGRGRGRVVVGNGGFKGCPQDHTVEIGYSVMEAFQGRGYGTEAARALVRWAFQHDAVHRVIAETHPEFARSIRLLEKLGFTPAGAGSEPRIERFEVMRETFQGA